MLEVKHINKNFGGVVAINDFSMTVEQGQRVGIIGPNGAGKTTILNCISNIMPADSGEIFMDGVLLNRKKRWQVSRAGIARTFQNIRLFGSMTVVENVMTIMGVVAEKKSNQHLRERSEALLKDLGWTERMDVEATSLPYGLQRKLELVRAIASQPKILMLDEPAAGLNPTEIGELIEYVNWLHGEHGISILLIEHRMEMITNICTYVYVQNYGKTIAQGATEEIMNDPVVIQAYLGEED